MTEQARRASGSPLTVAGAATDLPPDQGPARTHGVPFSPARAGPSTSGVLAGRAGGRKRFRENDGLAPWHAMTKRQSLGDVSPTNGVCTGKIGDCAGYPKHPRITAGGQAKTGHRVAGQPLGLGL